jgi:hypothetical protein
MSHTCIFNYPEQDYKPSKTVYIHIHSEDPGVYLPLIHTPPYHVSLFALALVDVISCFKRLQGMSESKFRFQPLTTPISLSLSSLQAISYSN